MSSWQLVCLVIACGGAPACDGERDGIANVRSEVGAVGRNSGALAHACWPPDSTDEQKVCADGWFFSMQCFKLQESEACGPGSDGGFALCRHPSHGEAPAPECGLEGRYSPAPHSLAQTLGYAAALWQSSRSVGEPVFKIPPQCTSCTDLAASLGDILPTEVLETGLAAGRSAGTSGVSAAGAATYSLPLWVPPGRMGMQPALSLEYNSRGGDGLLGKGWSLGGFSRVTRCGRTLAQDGEADAIRFDSSDRFCLDGVRLVAVNGPYGGHLTEYRTENNIFARIISLNPDGLGPLTFEAWLKDGRILTFGGDVGSRVEGKRARVTPSGSTGMETDFSQEVRYAWAVSHVRDRSGNFMRIYYELTTGVLSDFSVEQWPVVIDYTGSSVAGATTPTRRVQFFYGERGDPTVEYVSGLRLRRRVRLDRVEMWGPSPSGTTRVREYRLGYGTPTISGRTLLTSLQECDGMGVCKSPTSFNWTTGMTSFRHIDTGITDVASGSGDYPEHMWSSSWDQGDPKGRRYARQPDRWSGC